MGVEEIVRGTGCRLLQREGSVGVWVGGVGSLAVDYWGGNRWAQARHVVCGVQRERVICNGCIMSSCVDIFEGGWLGWLYVKDVVWIVDVG